LLRGIQSRKEEAVDCQAWQHEEQVSGCTRCISNTIKKFVEQQFQTIKNKKSSTNNNENSNLLLLSLEHFEEKINYFSQIEKQLENMSDYHKEASLQIDLKPIKTTYFSNKNFIKHNQFIFDIFGTSQITCPSISKLIADSGKLKTLDLLLGKLKLEGHRVLIFCQMTKMMDLLEDYMYKRRYTFYRLDGSTSIL
jgi:SNF2 family DNA or RNA helicase